MDYWKYTFRLDAQTNDAETTDILTAYLADAPFDTFEETEHGGLNAYIPADAADTSEVEDLLETLRERLDFAWEKTFIPGQNWNELWERNFHPVVVGDFCAVRADFHEPIPGIKHELVINPKMAFGTGHHETTWQCIAAMEHLPIAEKKILDFGCGTGVLAILASKLGAAEVEAIDIEEESYLNTLENSAVNNVSNVIARCGALEVVKGHDFDGILANINRNVILDALPTLSRLLKPYAWLLVSGILLQDEAVVTDAAAKAGFEKKKKTERGNWLCMEFRRK